MASDEQDRRKAVDRLLPFQREDFIGIFTAMARYPVTIRLLDPPLHEFLPQVQGGARGLHAARCARDQPSRHQELGVIKARLEACAEANPMLGHRGCRLGITFPEIYEMQVRAIMEAACEVGRRGHPGGARDHDPAHRHRGGDEAHPRDDGARRRAGLAETGLKVPYSVGTMIEMPRAALVADKIAEHAEFFSFGTNDLTQMTFGYSRDDIGEVPAVLPREEAAALRPVRGPRPGGRGRADPDRHRARQEDAARDLKVGICGEHGGEPSSVEFCHRVGMTTCRARRSWSPSPGWRRLRPRSRSRERGAKRAA